MIGPGLFSAAPPPAEAPLDSPPLPDPGRGDGASFPTVLLALASIGQVHAFVPTPAAASTPGSGTDDPAAVVAPSVHDDGSALAGGDDALLVGDGISTEIDDDDDAPGANALAGLVPSRVAELPDAAPDDEPAWASVGAVTASAGEDAEVPPSDAVAQERPDTVTLDPSMLRGLDRSFAPRLQRVAERMWEEHGLRVQVVEGFRSQQRQNTLFAQGRTTDGPVVTWTRRSLHTAGVAADVYVDGAPVSPETAALLARVATEEGLKTLYPYDSGHIQMATAAPEGPDVPADQSLPTRGGAGEAPARGIARVAPVARPARPARPGGVVMADPIVDAARTTEVEALDVTVGRASGSDRMAVDAARVGVDARGRSAGGPSGPLPPAAERARGATPAHSTDAVPDGTGGTRTASETTTATTEVADTERGVAPATGAPAADAHAVRTADTRATAGGAAASTEPPGPIDFAELREGLTYRRMRLPIDGVAGRASLDLGVGPTSIDARLNVSDPELADALHKSLHELRRTLAERGVEARGLSVKLTADGASEMLASRAEPLASARSTDGEAGQSLADDGRRRSARHEDPTESRDERRRSSHPNDRREQADDTGRR